jgi:transposase
MTFTKGDRVRNEDGDQGVILFVDKGGLEAQVAFQRLTSKVRTEFLSKMAPGELMILPAASAKPRRAPAKRIRASHAPSA